VARHHHGIGEGVISKLKDGHASDRFMFLYINGRFVEKTPIHRQIANFYATSSLSNASQGHLMPLVSFCFLEQPLP
jgi:DNA mismatch repair ATPase MutL